MKMREKSKKILSITALTLVMFFTFTLYSSAENASSDSLYKENIDKLMSLLDEDDETTEEILDSLGLDDFSPEKIGSISIKDSFRALIGIFQGAYKVPFSALLSVFGLILLVALTESYIQKSSEFSGFTETICSMFVSLLIFSKIVSCISDAAAALHTVSVLTKALVPVMAAVTAFTGNTALALSYNAVSVYSAEIISAVCTDVLTPVLCIFAALSICGAVNGSVKINPVLAMIKKLFGIVLGLAGTVFTGIIAVKDVLNAGIDRVSVKGLKFILGSSVPVVGGALSEGLASVISAASLMKNAYGIFGIIIIAAVTLPVICELLLWLVSLTAASYVAEAFSQSRTYDVLSSLKFVFSMLLSLVLFSVFVLIISTAMVILMSSK